MKQIPSRSRPRAAPDLERLLGVRGLAAGRVVAARPWMALFATDIPVREQVWIGLRFVGLGLLPPLLLAVLLAMLTWARGEFSVF